MCGICGILYFDKNQVVDRNVLVTMRDELTHRGPDDAGIYIKNNLGLGHNRLSIIDPTPAGHQPMCNEDGTVWIVYNGEVYNYPEIKRELSRRGHSFRSNTDSEVIIHAYEEFGEDCVDKFRGMFAFAIWDERKGTLFMARDRLGIKPFYYYFHKNAFVFASEVKAVLSSGLLRAELDEQIIPHYLTNRYPPGDRTFFRGIKKLLPGNTLRVDEKGAVRIQSYWDVVDADGRSETFGLDEGRIARRFYELFEESVRLRLLSDVPLGMFLSGGIDSSAICAVMKKLTNGPIKTFSVGFDDEGANENEYARLVARHLKTDHHETTLTTESFFETLPRMIWHEDEPIAHPSSIPLYFVSLLAGEHVKVVLTGEGSDELLAGYYRYPRTLWNIRLGKVYEKGLPRSLRRIVCKGIDKLSPGSPFFSKLGRTFLARPLELESIYADNFSVFHLDQLKTLFNGNLSGDTDPFSEFKELSERVPDGEGTLKKMLYADIKTYLVELLMKQDQMSMAASVESRVPFLDHKLVEFSFWLPDDMKVRGFTTKYILRETMKSILPGEILKRGKMGFPVPLDNWFKGSYRGMIEGILSSERFKKRKLINPVKVKELLEQHDKGIRKNGDRLWLLLNLELWQRIFIDGEDPVEMGRQL
jgi:asparagine synthase (glutamine-hydrolysing)